MCGGLFRIVIHRATTVNRLGGINPLKIDIVQPPHTHTDAYTRAHTHRSNVMITLSLYCRLNMNHSESNLLEYNSFPRRQSRKKKPQKDEREADHDISLLDFAEPFEHVEATLCILALVIITILPQLSDCRVCMHGCKPCQSDRSTLESHRVYHCACMRLHFIVIRCFKKYSSLTEKLLLFSSGASACLKCQLAF